MPHRLVFAALFWLLAADATAQHIVTIDSNGHFDPPDLTIRSGDTVEWAIEAPGRGIVRLEDAELCDSAVAWDPLAENAFTGPLPRAPSGIVALAPQDGARRVYDVASAPPDCVNPPMSNGQIPPVWSDGDDYFCPDPSLPGHQSHEEVIEHPAVRMVFIRYDWNALETRPDDFEFEPLIAEIDRIVAAGKLYSLGIRAGVHGTPEWLDTDLNLPIHQFRDRGSDPTSTGCGTGMFLPDPTDTVYGQRYTQMLAALAAELKSDAARWRALAYVKPSGANLFTDENRLPNRCDPECPICNTAVWAAAGYTPEGLYRFYSLQFHAIAAHFPGKSMGYQLIQDGFPRVTDTVHYLGCVEPACEGIPGIDIPDFLAQSGPLPTVTMPSGRPVGLGDLKFGGISFLPSGSEQTEGILAIGRTEQGGDFVVQHNGLGPASDYAMCATDGIHPANPLPTGAPPGIEDYTPNRGGCPNPWVLQQGALGQYTGWQTPAPYYINTLEQIDGTLQNLWDRSDGMFLELYQQLIWQDGRDGGPLDAGGSGLTLEQWSERLDKRRRDAAAAWGLTNLGDPYPDTHSFSFVNTGTSDLVYYFTDPAICVDRTNSIGTITVMPP